MKRSSFTVLATVIAGVALFAGGRSILAQTTQPAAPAGNSVVNSKHNLNTVFSSITSTTDDYGSKQVCMPCHTPHQQPAANAAANLAKLWNHEVSTKAYTLYNGTSSGYLATVDETSLKCLGCHDGTIAVDSFGSAVGNSSFTSTSGVMPAGFVIGANGNLQHDHPIDMPYNKGSSYTVNGTTNSLGAVIYTTTWSGSNNDPGQFALDGYFSAKWNKWMPYTVTGLSAIGFYKPSTAINQAVSWTDGYASGTYSGSAVAGTQVKDKNNVSPGNGGYIPTYSHSINIAGQYVYCRSCHDPHNSVYHFMRIPNDNSQVCLTCHNK